LARRDADGLYYIVGRISRFLKIMGNRVNLEELEHLLGSSGIECACAGEDDKLMVYVTDAEQSDSALQCVRKITKLHPSAIKTVVIRSIPRNETGKIIYADLPR
jgi:long-chain acyl-CoA synthetase